MRSLSDLFETYLITLVHPFRIHHQFRHHVPLGPNEVYEPLTLAEALGISWIFAIVRGLFKLLVLNYFLQVFLSMHTPEFRVLQELVQSSGFSTYYFLLFSASLDIIFFPIGAIIITEVWAWVIRLYARFLDPDLPAQEIADQITTHALSSHLFTIIPFLGDVIQAFLYLFLIYAGLRSNLSASRSLSIVILLTPTVIAFMLFSLLAVVFFYLVS
jgi:hypothetical protein